MDDLIDTLEDFDSEDLDDDEAEDEDDADQRGRNSFVSDLWDRYGFTEVRTRADKADALVTAHKMVTQFVDTFAGGGTYQVTFDPSLTTAGTDIMGKKIVITPGPVFDPNLTPRQAGLILTAMATHEASHPRYGRSTFIAAVKVFGRKRAPNALSNLIDDVRIERRFAADYPGYSDVFRPMLDYIGSGYRAAGVKPKLEDLVNLSTLAIRYERCVDWPTPELVAEREWWKAWADKWGREDAPRRHVEAVREGLKHIAEIKAMLKARNEVRAKREPKPMVPEPESVTRIKAVLASMTPLQRNAVRMFSQGRTGPEIAATLGLRHDDAKILIRTARTQLTMAARGLDIRQTTLSSLRQTP